MIDFIFLLFLSCFTVILLIIEGPGEDIEMSRPENKVRFYLQELGEKGIKYVASGDPGEITTELSQQAEEYVSENRKKYEEWYDRNRSK